MPHACRRIFAITLLATVLTASAAFAQQSVGIGTSAPNPRAALDIAATDKGLLIPRMDSSQRAAIAAPPDGLMVFQTNGRKGFWYAVGGTWVYIPDKTRSGDNLGNHTATQPLRLNGQPLTNNGTGGLRLDNAGQVGIGTAAPAAPLHVAVAAGTYNGTFSVNLAPLATATASSVYNTTLTASKINDNDTGLGWASDATLALPQWVRLDFGTTPRTVRRYTVFLPPTSNAPGAWRFQGSQDATTWTTLHTVSTNQFRNITNSYSVPNTTAYRYYRLLVTASYNNGTSWVYLSEWGLHEENMTPTGLALRVNPGALQLESGVAVRSFSPDGTLAANADDAVPTQQAVKTYVDQKPGDNLGNHTATQPLLLNGQPLTNNGTGGLRIDNAGQVGIGTTPAAPLDVNGRTRATAYTYSAAQTRYLTLPVSAFKSVAPLNYALFQVSSTLGVMDYGFEGYLVNGNNLFPGFVTAPVCLPQGAVITNVAMTAYDEDGSAYTPKFSLNAYQPLGPGRGHTYFITAHGQLPGESSDWQTVSVPSNHRVDNAQYVYQMMVRLRQATATMGFTNVRITYTVTQAD